MEQAIKIVQKDKDRLQIDIADAKAELNELDERRVELNNQIKKMESSLKELNKTIEWLEEK